jgi:hypothetical protein
MSLQACLSADIKQARQSHENKSEKPIPSEALGMGKQTKNFNTQKTNQQKTF